MRRGVMIWLACIASILASLGPWSWLPASAQSAEGSLVIYSYACPEGFSGTGFAACRDTPLADVGYHAAAAGQDNGLGAASSANGDASFPLSAIGGGTVNVIVNPPAGYESIGTACSQEYGAIDGGITIANVATDAFVTCEWYFAPVASGPPPVQRDDPSTAPVTALPVTGTGPVERVREMDSREWAAIAFGAFAMVGLHLAHERWRRGRKRADA